MMETERLVIRRFTADDWRDLHEYLSDEAVVRFEPYRAFTEDASKEEAIRRAGDDAFWAVCLKDGGKLIGNLYFARQYAAEFETWELGYVFGAAYQHQGYAAESARRVLGYGFGECGAHRVVANCDVRNPASWRLMERLGMRREGHFLQNAFFWRDEKGNPIWKDDYEYAMLASEWAERVR